MKHLNKKTLIRGAGKGAPKPEPAILNPPKMGGFKSIASSSVAEILDLISDGPIKGLVDQNGTVLNSDIFKGIYLDNTPIQNTLISSSSESYGTLSVDEIVKSFSNFYITTDQKYKYYQGLQNANDFA